MVDATPLRRLCSKCGESKPITSFYRQKNCRDGRRADCTECCKRRSIQTYLADTVKGKASRADYYARNKPAMDRKNREWREANPERARINASAWAKANPEAKRAADKKWARDNDEHVYRIGRCSHLRRKFGITLAEYEIQLSRQEGLCAICKSSDPGGAFGRAFVVDHDHGTGALRGLLCFNCNTAIGLMKDSAEALAAAIIYLESPPFQLTKASKEAL